MADLCEINAAKLINPLTEIKSEHIRPEQIATKMKK